MCFDDYNEYNDDPANYDDLGELNRNEALDYLYESENDFGPDDDFDDDENQEWGDYDIDGDDDDGRYDE